MSAGPDVTTPAGLDATLAIVREVARDAARLVLGGFRHGPAVEHKGPVDLVTEFDRRSEALVRERLASELPFALVGEEAGGRPASGHGATFYVDPLDGTTNFVHGHPFWSVSIGLVATTAGTPAPVLGVVIAPVLGLEWAGWIAPSGERRAVRVAAENAMFATGERAATTEGTCAVSATSELVAALLATGFPYDRTGPDNNFDTFVAIKRRCQAVRRCGSAAIDLCLVADGTYDGYWERRLRPWDLAGGSAIVRAAGGRVTDLDGGGAFLAHGSVAATNGVLHATLLAEIARSDGQRTASR
jgi:myo-inositol-1(or 4)-monophosphatase